MSCESRANTELAIEVTRLFRSVERQLEFVESVLADIGDLIDDHFS
jgi:hypothetical protein